MLSFEHESRQYLTPFWKKYEDLSPAERRTSSCRVFVRRPTGWPLFIAISIRTATMILMTFMREQLPDLNLKDDRLERMFNQYGPGKF